MQHFTVTGMTCAACSAHVEKAVRSVEGVTAVSVNLLTNSMQVEGTASAEAIEKAVADAGYGAVSRDKEQSMVSSGPDLDSLRDTQTPKMKKRLLASVILLIPLMYVSMGAMMWGCRRPAVLA